MGSLSPPSQSPPYQTYNLHPANWEDDPEVERRPVGVLDYFMPQTYNNYALFFRFSSPAAVTEEDKIRVVETLKAGFEHMFSQVRHLVGRLERNPEKPGELQYVRRKGDTVRFDVQHLGSEEAADGKKYPSMDELEEKHFRGVLLGDLKVWSIPGMTYGCHPPAHPSNNPVISAYKLNFIRGGFILNMHHHHFANDVIGWVGYTTQLSKICQALSRSRPIPPFPLSCLDNSALNPPSNTPPSSDKPIKPQVYNPPDPTKKGVSLLFHLPASKAAALKSLASSDLSSSHPNAWISTFDSLAALLLRSFIRLSPLDLDPATVPFYTHTINLRPRLSPPLHPGHQFNCIGCPLSVSPPAGVVQPTVGDIVSGWSLGRLALYVREMTQGIVTLENGVLDGMIREMGKAVDKVGLSIRLDELPEGGVYITDHRDVGGLLGGDWGFGKGRRTKLVAYRHLVDSIDQGGVVVYPSRAGVKGDEEEGIEFVVFAGGSEEVALGRLAGDREWGEWFEFRGLDGVDLRGR
ncbi:hypothetical protein QC763_308315 [Podospora pseudopauciseta]|uniref:Trichothecene 3-O-acetyltransferase-like N-terminal domain-containing protein n=1 Tax=Podospora pseudopauciseta TaxID=2093780 RepID=A0ABR0HGX8_9PEZI|nr:hypothetical protein QC763_308315 [Podospora pseudopauciseta]